MIRDEDLMAFADGVLDADRRARVEAAVAADPALAAKVARMRRVTAELRGAFTGQLDIEAPARLLAPFEAKVVRFPTRRQTAWVSLAAAACFALAFVAGRATAPDMIRVDSARGLVAAGALQEALDGRVSNGGEARVQVALSFPNRAGGYCRVFRTDGNVGLACGESGDWRIVSLTEATPGQATRVTQAAGALPEAILDAAAERRSGDPLDAAGEAAAIRQRWRTR